MTPLIRNAEVLNFYFMGIRLRDTLKLRDLQHMHQKNDKNKPVLIYTKRKYDSIATKIFYRSIL